MSVTWQISLSELPELRDVVLRCAAAAAKNNDCGVPGTLSASHSSGGLTLTHTGIIFSHRKHLLFSQSGVRQSVRKSKMVIIYSPPDQYCLYMVGSIFNAVVQTAGIG